MKIAYADATAAQLRHHANTVAGLDLPKSLNTMQIRAKIMEVGTEPEMIDVDDDAPAASLHGTAPAGRAAPEAQVLGPKGDPRVEITINKSSDIDGKRGVFVSVEGVGIVIPRAQRCTIAYRFYEALNNAVETNYTEDTRTGLMDEAAIHKYPFMVHKLPDDAEVQAWQDGIAATEKSQRISAAQARAEALKIAA